MFLVRRIRYFSTNDTSSKVQKVQSLSSYFKENAQPILTAAIILGGVFAAGAYSTQTAAAMKALEENKKAPVMALEEKNKARLMVLEERIKTTY